VSGAPPPRRPNPPSTMDADTTPFADLRPRKHIRDFHRCAEEESGGMCYRTGRSFRLSLRSQSGVSSLRSSDLCSSGNAEGPR
jgi:hypothetical protein